MSTTDPRITAVIDNLSSLILHHARLLASEQYAPHAVGADESDDLIRQEREWVTKLRAIRNDFEDLVTGVLPP